jgi:hypothetical protein
MLIRPEQEAHTVCMKLIHIVLHSLCRAPVVECDFGKGGNAEHLLKTLPSAPSPLPSASSIASAMGLKVTVCPPRAALQRSQHCSLDFSVQRSQHQSVAWLLAGLTTSFATLIGGTQHLLKETVSTMQQRMLNAATSICSSASEVEDLVEAAADTFVQVVALQLTAANTTAVLHGLCSEVWLSNVRLCVESMPKRSLLTALPAAVLRYAEQLCNTPAPAAHTEASRYAQLVSSVIDIVIQLQEKVSSGLDHNLCSSQELLGTAAVQLTNQLADVELQLKNWPVAEKLLEMLVAAVAEHSPNQFSLSLKLLTCQAQGKTTPTLFAHLASTAVCLLAHSHCQAADVESVAQIIATVAVERSTCRVRTTPHCIIHCSSLVSGPLLRWAGLKCVAVIDDGCARSSVFVVDRPCHTCLALNR